MATDTQTSPSMNTGGESAAGWIVALLGIWVFAVLPRPDQRPGLVELRR